MDNGRKKRIAEEFMALVDVVAELRGPMGCPWDRQQDHRSLRRYLIEETYEVVEAIDQGSLDKLEEELGDVLLQVLLHSQIANEEGSFDIADVCRRIRMKLIRRHPHVFGGLEVSGVDEVLSNWEHIKSREPGKSEMDSAISGVPSSLPALMRASEISKKAARVGFEWPDLGGVLAKLKEEVSEVEESIASGDEGSIKHEIGDLLFAVVNLARWLKVDPEESLREMLERFRNRFEAIERHARSEGRHISDMTIEEMDAVWNSVKK
jgi:tetrapyrrole methylase family protein/MazG family protein